MFKFFLVIVPIWLATSSATAQPSSSQSKTLPASTSGGSMMTIGGIDGESDDAMSLINIRFVRKPSWTKLNEVQEHGSFLQIVLPNTIVPNPGEFYEGNSPYIQKIAAFQLTPNSAGVRLFTTENAAKTKQAANVELLGKRLVFTIDHVHMKELLAAKTAKRTVNSAPKIITAPAATVPAVKISTSDKTAKTVTAKPTGTEETEDLGTPKKDNSDKDNSDKDRSGNDVSDFAEVYKNNIEAPAASSAQVLVRRTEEVPEITAPNITANSSNSDDEKVPAAATAEVVPQAKKETPIGTDEIPPLDPKATAAAVKAANEVIATTEVRRDIPEPASLIKANDATTEKVALDAVKTSAPHFGSNAPNLRGRLIQVSIFSGAMLIFLALVWLVKPYLRKRGQTLGNEPIISMKTLASLPLAAKQKVSLIQVGDQQILLGVTPENVTFITTIKNGVNTASVKATQSLLQGNSFAKLLAEPEAESFEMRPSPFNQVSRSNNPERPVENQETKRPFKPTKPQTDLPQKQRLQTKPTTAPITAAAVASAKAAQEARTSITRPSSNRIAVSIGDDGITDHRKPNATTAAANEHADGQKAIDDVTKMIREKLKNLRSI
jgi:flagellar protein FliO/FliZ